MMKFLGILLALAGWMLPVVGLTMTQSTGMRLVLCVFGLALAVFAILVVLNKAHLKQAVWKHQ